MPPGGSELWTIWTSIAGASFMRSICMKDITQNNRYGSAGCAEVGSRGLMV